MPKPEDIDRIRKLTSEKEVYSAPEVGAAVAKNVRVGVEEEAAFDGKDFINKTLMNLYKKRADVINSTLMDLYKKRSSSFSSENVDESTALGLATSLEEDLHEATVLSTKGFQNDVLSTIENILVDEEIIIGVCPGSILMVLEYDFSSLQKFLSKIHVDEKVSFSETELKKYLAPGIKAFRDKMRHQANEYNW